MTAIRPDTPDALKEILESLTGLDPNDRAELLIDYAASWKEPPSEIAPRPYPREAKIQGCESEVYLFSRLAGENALEIYFAVENPQGISAKALAAILQQSFSGGPLSALDTLSTEVVTEIFGKTLSMGKGVGLTEMIRAVKMLPHRYTSGTTSTPSKSV